MTKASNPYEDMLLLPHHVSSVHPRMPLRDRAAQFAPFAALAGYGAAIAEAARLTAERIELDESRKAVLNRRLNLALAHIRERPVLTVTYFKADEKKSGGAYIRATGPLKKIDELQRRLLLADGTAIPLEGLFDLEGDLFEQLRESAE